MKPLTAEQSSRLDELEKVVHSGKQTFVSVGLALAEIRENLLYLHTHETFEDYCQKKWGWSARRSYQLMNAAAVVQALPKVDAKSISHSATASELAKIAPEKRSETVRELVASGEPVTPARVRQEVIKRKAEPEVIQLDKTGYPIPQHLMPLWNRSQEIQDALSTVSRLKGIITTAQENKDVMFAEVNFSSVIANLSQVFTEIQTAKPFAVCTACQGQVPKSCTLCRGKGLLSEFRWKHTVPEEIKSIRSKAGK